MSPRPAASPELRFDSGRVCLDLAATVGARLSDAPVERLTDPARLDAWLAGVGLLDVGATAGDEQWLAGFLGLRELVHRLVHARFDGTAPDPDDVAGLNELAVRPGPPRVLRGGSGRDGVSWAAVADHGLQLSEALSFVARDAVDLLGGPDAELLHECEGSTCDLVFLDVSRGARRRWCSAGACGNRARVAQHRQRRRADVGDVTAPSISRKP